eukprot:TRINITY_DN1199_c0_g2_i1.p1 TRINITY_DN1199_c0_g2~~TRINITY_DN1199_c0_g2_i1.p1  ORF type:complete len:622 (+),score=281.82 TRINITY_DN1199_c0_g2_i1:82-1866(+)
MAVAGGGGSDDEADIRGGAAVTSPPSGGAADPRLERVVEEQRAEIERLRALFAGRGEGALEHKYLDALRRTKAINVKLESERARADRLQQQLGYAEGRIIELERLQQQALPGAPSTSRSPQSIGGVTGAECDDVDKLRRDLKEAKSQLDRANRLSAELRRTQAAQKQEAVRLKEVLRRELGDGADVEKLAAEDSEGWRGRAQQITLLKAKVKELQRAAAAAQQGDGQQAGDARSVAASTTAFTATTAARDFDDVHRRALESAAAARKVKDAELQMHSQELERVVKEQKERADAAVARQAVLEKECAAMRVQLQRIVAKTENDDKLVDAYKDQLAEGREELRRLKLQLGKQQQRVVAAPGAGAQQAAAAAAAAEPSDFFPQRVAELEGQLEAAEGRAVAAERALREARGAAASQPAAGTATSPSGGSGGGGAEAELLREYVEELRGAVQTAQQEAADAQAEVRRLRAEQRSAEAPKPPAKRGQQSAAAAGFDVSQLPPAVVERINMLKGENRSLSERVAFLQHTMDREIALWRDVADRQRAELSGAKQGEEGGSPGPGSASNAQLQEELRQLRGEYEELKRAYNGQMQRRLRAPS